jgi:hypothetical protein
VTARVKSTAPFTVTADELAGASALGPAIAAELRAQCQRAADAHERRAVDALTSEPPPIPYPDVLWWEQLLRRPPPAGYGWTAAESRAILVAALTEFYTFNGYHPVAAAQIAEVLAGRKRHLQASSPGAPGWSALGWSLNR